MPESKQSPFTPDEATFIRTFKRFWTTPSDWNHREMVQGTSSFIDVHDWLANPMTDIEIIGTALGQLAETSRSSMDRPTISAVKAVYYRLRNKRHEDTGPREKCEACNGSGTILVPVWLPSRSIIPLKMHRRAWDLSNSALVASLCKCSRGDKLKTRSGREGEEAPWEHITDDLRARAFANRTTLLDWHYATTGARRAELDTTETVDNGKDHD